MADDKVIGQDEIEKLLSQGAAGAESAAKPSASSGAEGANSQSLPGGATMAASDADADKSLGQADIDSLLNQAGKSQSPVEIRSPSPSQPGAEASMAEKDIEYLLNQAERALESIGSTAKEDLPQGVSAFRLQELGGAPASTETATLDLVRDVELNLKIELGRTHMYLEDVLKLRKGSVVPLDKLAGDPVDVYVNGRLVARGEVLVLNDNFCVRVAELIAGANVFN
jgi:flagellar motor switch protein FliN